MLYENVDTSQNAAAPVARPMANATAASDPQGLMQSLLSFLPEGLRNNLNMDSFAGSIDPKTNTATMGWGMPVIQGLGSLGNAYMGMKQYGLAKDQLSESKRQFNENFNTQKQLINTRMRDRQAARVSANPNAYQGVDPYMKKNEVK